MQNSWFEKKPKDQIKEQLKWAINGIDIVGCELTQNISKKRDIHFWWVYYRIGQKLMKET